MRLEYPININIIRVPCTGKVDVMHLLRAIQKGADGAYCVGCLEGTCHYNEGNLRCRERVEHVQMLLEEIGIESERLEMVNMSAGMGHRFAQVATEITEKIRNLGPSPVKTAIAQ